MRYWVHALRYVKSYWSKLEVRETVLNEEQEKKLLERLLREEEIEDDVSLGEILVLYFRKHLCLFKFSTSYKIVTSVNY